MGRVIIVSNRLPVSVSKRDGELRFSPSPGGLATGLSSFYKRIESVWVGWPGITSEKLKPSEMGKIRGRLREEHCHPVFLSQRDVERYYQGFSNKTIWPLFHYFPIYTVNKKSFWESYKEVNRLFCREVVKIAEPGDIIWIHDYHLLLLPKLVRERLPSSAIGFFLHIPFPSFEIFRLHPWREEILEGVLGADLIGFHTYDYVLHFLESARRLLSYEHSLGQINVENRMVKVDAFPMGIDFEKFATANRKPAVKKEINKIKKRIGDRRVILSIGRMDYTKGIPDRLEAFDLFLERNSDYRGKVTLILVAVPSRTGVEHYVMLKRQVDELVGRINGKYGTIGWSPIWYIYRSLPFTSVSALYNIADVALVTPMRDGMNLVAKEFVASKVDGSGVLILSEMAGAERELGEAIVVNPNNKEEIAHAIKIALTMSVKEQVERNRRMQDRLRRYDVMRWADDFVERLRSVKRVQRSVRAKLLAEDVVKELLRDYRKSKKRLLLLDYDGTLVPFADRPERAKLDRRLLNLLKDIAGERGNEVVIISGRTRSELDRIFKRVDVGLVAEHGVWIKEKGGEWELIEPLKNDWKEQIRPVLELYADRTPGSFVEEKEFSLVWHYRNANPEMALVRSGELKDALLHLTANLNLGILEGNKVIEIKSVGVNKGRAALRWLSKKRWDFILAVGDDLTDEDVFDVLPKGAYSVKVGSGPSKARFNVEAVTYVRRLLQRIRR
mgnify:CR=1 FL=1